MNTANEHANWPLGDSRRTPWPGDDAIRVRATGLHPYHRRVVLALATEATALELGKRLGLDPGSAAVYARHLARCGLVRRVGYRKVPGRRGPPQTVWAAVEGAC